MNTHSLGATQASLRSARRRSGSYRFTSGNDAAAAVGYSANYDIRQRAGL